VTGSDRGGRQHDEANGRKPADNVHCPSCGFHGKLVLDCDWAESAYMCQDMSCRVKYYLGQKETGGGR
jgi:hypothetical protein